MAKNGTSQREGLLLISAYQDVRGLGHWSDELDKRGITAVIQVQQNILDENSSLIKDLSAKGFEISGLWTEEAFWNKPYGYQYEKMRCIQDDIQSCIGKRMRIFNSRYFAYDETTLRVADELGIEFIFARGTAGARAMIYQPAEYKARIISVSNVHSAEMGTGSLCDYSLWARGEAPDNFRKLLFDLKENKIVLVSHTHIGGTKLNWWRAYEDYLNCGLIVWKSIDEFASEPIVLPIAQIPVNTEVKYGVPSPKVPLEREPECPGLCSYETLIKEDKTSCE